VPARSGHAIAFGRLDDGTCFIYDSAGLLGDRANQALVRLGRHPDLAGDDAIADYYRRFSSVLKVRRQAPRMRGAAGLKP